MNNRPEIDRYVLTEMDEEGNVWCEYSGKNNFSFHNDRPAGQFRVFRIAMHVLAFMFGQVVYKLLSQLFLRNGEIIHARATERKSLCLESVRRTGPPAG